jgi:formate hydrogenlyase subunit 3/multisubunit Na+/H+ antiporter MnhD subunit
MNNQFLYPLFKIDRLNAFMAVAIVAFCALAFLYSIKTRQGKTDNLRYYLCLFFTAVTSVGAILANNLIALLVCWGFLGLLLYLLINLGDSHPAAAAKKAFVIVGGTDALMLLGIGIIFCVSGSFQMDAIRLELNSLWTIVAYVCIAIACFAKAGAVPFHTWIPECAKEAPIPVVALLPASLDKLLGIYLLARISLDLFVMNPGMNIFLMVIGAVTIIAAVMMALIQHNMKKLLGYHAVSQVGYMVLGIGTGIPLGIAGGLFHMLNHAVYKFCLFISAGNVEYRAKGTELDELGGLAKAMPLTYIMCLIASLSISGVPPFNGFVSKWMIYQGLVDQIHNAGSAMRITSSICIVAAMFGSGLTLASFMKLLHATFFGQRTNNQALAHVREVPWQMWVPGILLAGVCVLFGVFAFSIPLKLWILPAVGGEILFIGRWYAGVSTMLIGAALLLGIIVFTAIKAKRPGVRNDSAFIGGEPIDLGENRVSGTGFYAGVREYGLLKNVFNAAEKGRFDIYEQGKKIFSLSRLLQHLHNGVLPTYAVWMLLGMIGLFLALIR